jgi:hypothetical protein
MTTNFTFRDFFVYLITGQICVISIGVIFFTDIFEWSINFFNNYKLIEDSCFLITIFIVPVIYLLGHFIGFLSYYLINCYKWLSKNKFFKPDILKLDAFTLKVLQCFYFQSVFYAIIRYTESDNTEKLFKNVEEFWVICAKLQIEKVYAPAEYWYVLNEMFKSINLIFLISSIISFKTGHLIHGIVFIILTIFAFKRAKQYANHFIQTVNNLLIANKSLGINHQMKYTTSQ